VSVAARNELTPYVRTTFAVWEITLRCSLSCSHCGSRAGAARQHELTTAEALDLVAQLADAGIREVALIGGEAFLRSDWLQIAEAIRDAGMVCSMTTSGFGLSRTAISRIAKAGMRHVSVSVDGLEETHDQIRRAKGSFAAALAAIRALADEGVLTGANTQINRLSAPELPQLYERLVEAGIQTWQVQLTVPSGRAADRPEILLQPWELIELYEILARLAVRGLRDGISLAPGNNVGYHGPYDDLLRRAGASAAIGEGCQAGVSVLGIEADGTIKGCPSLPRSGYSGGNIRTKRLREMLDESSELHFNRPKAPTRTVLWGFCAGCEFAQRCRGGCSWTAQALFGRPGNNPYCHHRVLSFASRGLRERLVHVHGAPGQPFDNGLFELAVEALDAPVPGNDDARLSRSAVVWPIRDDLGARAQTKAPVPPT
jgi:radical SAM protein with 4Fe4S-binding SPASM domain